MKNRIILLMISGVATVSTIMALSKPNIGGGYKETPPDDYVVIDQDEKKVLHYGDYQKDVNGIANRLILKCGERLSSNERHYIYEEKPNEDKYDEKCEDCFSNEK